MLQALSTPLGQSIASTASDVIMRQFDWPGADQIADRLAATNPLAMAEKKMPENIPDEAKAVISQLLAQNNNLQQQVQHLMLDQKYKLSTEQFKQHAKMEQITAIEATKREDTRSRDETEMDKQRMQSETAIVLAGLDGIEEVHKAVSNMNRSATQ